MINFKKFLFLLSGLFLLYFYRGFTGNDLARSQDIVYQSTDEIFTNPERGFYKPFGNLNPLTPEALKTVRSSGFSLILREYFLDKFINEDISNEILTLISNDFTLVRDAGLKVILRFAYTSKQNGPDAPLNIIARHLDQLKPVLEDNIDIIAVVQAGLIGAWGEWYYSTNNLRSPEAQKFVLDKLLDVIPVCRMIQVRTPSYKWTYIGNSSAIKKTEAFTGTKIARIGHHNDCFMASMNDYGTYRNVEEEKDYLNAEGLYVPLGGETCPPSKIEPAGCEKAQAEMRRLRWTYLNEAYYKGVNNMWISQGCMDKIKREMGYRIELIKGNYPGKLKKGSAFDATIVLKNTGYAPPFNPRAFELILENTVSKKCYVLKLKEDPRFWAPMEEISVKISAGLPKNIKAGNYKLYLNLPDPEPKIKNNPDYSIRMANKDVWVAEKGYNDLGVLININNKNKSEKFTGKLYFVEL